MKREPLPTRLGPWRWNANQLGWGLGVGTPILLLAWEARAGVFFLAKKRSKSSFRLFGRLGQGRDWSSSLDLESWVGGLLQLSFRLSNRTSYRRSPRGEIAAEVTTLRGPGLQEILLLSALLLSRYPFRPGHLPGLRGPALGCSLVNLGPAATEPRTFGVPLRPLQRDGDHGPRPVPHQR